MLEKYIIPECLFSFGLGSRSVDTKAHFLILPCEIISPLWIYLTIDSRGISAQRVGRMNREGLFSIISIAIRFFVYPEYQFPIIGQLRRNLFPFDICHIKILTSKLRPQTLGF